MSLSFSHTPSHSGDVPSPSSVLSQKRTVRACDQCRRRKTKCDAAIDRACDTCVKAGLSCSYGERVRQERGSAYVTYLENRVAELERLVGPTSAVQPDTYPPQPTQESQESTLSLSRRSSQPGAGTGERSGTSNSVTTLDRLETLVSRHDDTWRKYYSPISGLGVLKCLHELNCQRIVSNASVNNEQFLDIASVMDRALPSYVLFGSERDHLPPKPETTRYLDLAFTDCPWLVQMVDRTMIDNDLARIFTSQTFGNAVDDRDHLALIYAVLAMGQRFDRDPPQTQRALNNQLFPKGYRTFTAARAIVELDAFDRNIIALTTGALMGFYLQTCFAQSTAHLYISNAAAAALRMGLHEQTPVASLFGTDAETCKRLFRAIKVLDTYSASAIGLPCTIRTTDMDQTLPSNMVTSPFISQVRLVSILNETTEAAAKEQSASIDRLQNVAAKLDSWSNQESMLEHAVTSDPYGDEYGEFMQVKLSAAYIRLLVYSPFVHHITRFATGQSYHATISAVQCLDAAVSIVQIVEMLELHNRWPEAHPIVTQALIFAATVLLHIELYTNSGLARLKSTPCCPKAIGLLERFSTRSAVAADCMVCLRPIWQAVESHELNTSWGSIGSMSALQQWQSQESKQVVSSSPVSASGSSSATVTPSWIPQTPSTLQAAPAQMTTLMAGMSTTEPNEPWWTMSESTWSQAGPSSTQHRQQQQDPQQGSGQNWW